MKIDATTSDQDFASAAMMRLVVAGLQRQGIKVEMGRPGGAHLPREMKRALLADVMAAHGPLAILRIADAAHDMSPEPVVQALMNAADAGDLLDRWQRLERFSHGRHRVRVERPGPSRYRLRHGAKDDGPRASTVETLLVMAVLSMLIEQVEGVEVTMQTTDGQVLREKGRWVAADVPVACGSCDIEWHPRVSDPVLENGVSDAGLVDDLRRHLAADPMRRWTLHELARATGMSSRTLQRRLAAHSLTFSGLVADARLQTAAQYLCDRSGPGLAAIGFLAGYSDQAHFTRSFARAVGTTPAVYRADFAV